MSSSAPPWDLVRDGTPARDPLAPETTAPARLPTRWGEFTLVAFRFPAPAGAPPVEHVALVKGDVRGKSVLTRIHSSCLTGDVLGSHRCDCGPQLEAAIERIEAEGRGVVLYLNQEGRGIGLYNKILAYTLQDEGANTVEANERLGFDADARGYEQAAAMLRHLGAQSVRLMTNNPAKVQGLIEAGTPVSERVPHIVGQKDANRDYLHHKRSLMGHLLPE